MLTCYRLIAISGVYSLDWVRATSIIPHIHVVTSAKFRKFGRTSESEAVVRELHNLISDVLRLGQTLHPLLSHNPRSSGNVQMYYTIGSSFPTS